MKFKRILTNINEYETNRKQVGPFESQNNKLKVIKNIVSNSKHGTM